MINLKRYSNENEENIHMVGPYSYYGNGNG